MRASKKLLFVLAASIPSLLHGQNVIPTPGSGLTSPWNTKIASDVRAPLPTPEPKREIRSDTYWADVKRVANDALAAGSQTRIHYSVYRAADFREANKDVSVAQAQKRLNETGGLLASGYCNRLPVHTYARAGDSQFEARIGWKRPSPPGIYLDLSFRFSMTNSNAKEQSINLEIPDVAIPKWLNAYVFYTPPAPPERSYAVVFYVFHSM